MGDQSGQRRLAAILAADVVAYSRLMHEDEAGTVAAWQAARREVIDPTLLEFHGRVVKRTGDGFLAEFTTTESAVACAKTMQERLASHRLQFRMGINLGDITDDGEDIHGDGVNIAARLEGLAEPGSVYLSGAVYDQVHQKLKGGFENLGEHTVKNIETPIRVYRLSRALSTSVSGANDGPPRKRKRSKVYAYGAIGALILGVVGSVAAWRPWLVRVEPASAHRMSFKLPDKPSVAVLPFDNLSGEPDLRVVIDGLVDEVTTSLSKIPRLFVISRNSTFAYKGKAVRANKVAEDLGVRFVLEGSVRKSGPKVRFTVQLVDAVAGYEVWAETYDRELKDVLALQSDIALKIATELDVKLVSGERARIQRGTTLSLEAYEALLKAEAAPKDTRENNLAQIRMFESATKIDPHFAAAYAGAAIRQAQMGRVGFEEAEVAYREAELLARKAIEVNDTYPGGYLALSAVYRFRGEFEKSLELVEKAIDLAPNDAEAIMYKGRMLRLLPGRASEAIPLIKSAMRLNPRYPAVYVAQLSWAYFAAGQYKEAHDTALEYARRRPNSDHAHWRLALTYSLLGQPEKARAAAAQTLSINPRRTIKKTIELSPYAKSNPELLAAEIHAMRAAGFPEE